VGVEGRERGEERGDRGEKVWDDMDFKCKGRERESEREREREREGGGRGGGEDPVLCSTVPSAVCENLWRILHVDMIITRWEVNVAIR